MVVGDGSALPGYFFSILLLCTAVTLGVILKNGFDISNSTRRELVKLHVSCSVSTLTLE